MAVTPQSEPEERAADYRLSEREKGVAWRTTRLFRLGFDLAQILRLPLTRADIHHDAEALLKRGVPHELVVELLKEE